MAKKTLIIMVSMLLFLLTIACTSAPSSTSTPAATSIPMLTYENSVYAIKINYPQDWTKQEVTVPNFRVIFYSPYEEVHVSVLDYSPKQVTLDMVIQEIIQKVRMEVPNVKMGDPTPTTLAGYPAQMLVYTVPTGQSDIKMLNVYTVINNKSYVISYWAPSTRYQDFIQTVQQMIDSFEITPIAGQ